MGCCRFGCKDDNDSPIGTNIDYKVSLPDQDLTLRVCGLWEHYAREHNVLVSENIRNAILVADPNRCSVSVLMFRSYGEAVPIYFVNKSGVFGKGGYDHEIGDKPDLELIAKLSKIISDDMPNILVSRPGLAKKMKADIKKPRPR
ncbi:hypothetical protein JW711_03385 [Candidatus Woesearchaeota archaeon]|nr:hypothetical protein [Candidatus Woesearchaeota archaeon]